MPHSVTRFVVAIPEIFASRFPPTPLPQLKFPQWFCSDTAQLADPDFPSSFSQTPGICRSSSIRPNAS